jgi:hypothetical protein
MVRKNTSGHKSKRSAGSKVLRKWGAGGSGASTNPSRAIPGLKKAGFYRDTAKIKLLNMYNEKPDLKKVANFFNNLFSCC